MNLEEKDIKWKMAMSLNMTKCHHTVHRDEELKLQRETITEKTDGGYEIGKSITSYFIDDDKREFKSLDDLLKAFNEKFEIEYVRTIVPRKKNH